MKQLAAGILDGGRQFSKAKYGQKLQDPKTWHDFGFERPDLVNAVA